MSLQSTRRLASLATLLAGLGFCGSELGGDAAAQPPRGAARASGYLGRDGIPDHTAFLPPPPADDSALGKADREVYRATRALEGSQRWQLAAHDAEIGQRAMFRDFGCALGVELDPANAPALARAIARASADLSPIIGGAKSHYNRPRPFVAEPAPICVEASPQFAASGSYPSGHAASGWLHALLFASADPGSADAILGRGRVYGESRAVCGVHYVSDVEGGRAAATAVFAALAGNAEFAADIAAARDEIAAQKAAGARPAAEQCTLEADAARPPW